MNQLELNIETLGNRETIRQNTQRGEEIVKIPLNKIIIRDGFNVRVEYGDIKELANSILENGQTLPGRVDVLKDGTFVLTDGHRRFEALKLLEKDGHEGFFKAIVNTAKTTEEQRIIQMFTSQDNKPLMQHEVAELIKRLSNLGNNNKTIAKKIGKSDSYISLMLSFASESEPVKEMVRTGDLTVVDVVKLKRRMPIQEERDAFVQSHKNDSESTPAADEKDLKKVIRTSAIETKCNNLSREISDVLDVDFTKVLTIVKKHLWKD